MKASATGATGATSASTAAGGAGGESGGDSSIDDGPGRQAKMI